MTEEMSSEYTEVLLFIFSSLLFFGGVFLFSQGFFIFLFHCLLNSEVSLGLFVQLCVRS